MLKTIFTFVLISKAALTQFKTDMGENLFNTVYGYEVTPLNQTIYQVRIFVEPKERAPTIYKCTDNAGKILCEE